MIQELGTSDCPNIVLRQAVDVKLLRGCCVQAVERLRQKIESCSLDNLGQLQRGIYEREIELYRQKFLIEYDNKWQSASTMGKFLANWYGHRIVEFNPPVVVSVSLHAEVYSKVYYG